MCGIIGCVGVDDAANRVLNGLENLEYRGYDSAGLAVRDGDKLVVRKRAGQISELRSEFADGLPGGSVSIGHTRWSTHGPPTNANAHPHTSHNSQVAVVHNGIISNHEELRQRCEGFGYTFTSDTDTEVIAHLIEHHLEEVSDPATAIHEAISELEGSYAIGVLMCDRQEAYLARRGSPLVMGIGDDGYYFASDVPAFLEYTDQVVYLKDGDVLQVTADSYSFLEYGGQDQDRPVDTIDWDPEETGKGVYDHYMEKEIESQPTSLAKTIRGRVQTDPPEISFDSYPSGEYDDIECVHLVACGTSYHAAMYACRLLHARGMRAQVFRASTYDEKVPIDEQTLTIAVTQSGETADTLGALRTARRAGGRTLAVTNVVGSTVSRKAETTIYIRAGPEIGVAATKTFSSQVVTLALLTEELAADLEGAEQRDDLAAFLEAMQELPRQIEEVLAGSRIDGLCRKYYDRDEYFFIGHGLGHPVCLEGALKFKEITYKHAEGYASGELKHGPLALITSGVPIFAVMTGNGDEQTRINANEAQSRGADIIVIGDDSEEYDFAEELLPIPTTHPDLRGLLANVQLQLVSYHSARLLERPIDKPRNLAKSVTVS